METYQTIGAETTVLENDATLEDLLFCRCEGRKKESEFTYKKREISSDHFVDYPKNDKVYERARTTEAVHANELWVRVTHKRVVLI